MAILFTPAEPAIRYGNITIPHVARQAEPLLKPRMNESVIRAFSCKLIMSSYSLQDKCGQLKVFVVRG